MANGIEKYPPAAPPQLNADLMTVEELHAVIADGYKDMQEGKTFDFQVALDRAKAWAKEVGYAEDDVAAIVKTVRQRKHE